METEFYGFLTNLLNAPTMVGRPTNLEQTFKKLDQGLIDVMARSSQDLPIAYQIVHDTMVAQDSSPTNKFSAAKYIIEYSEKSFKALLEQLQADLEAENAELDEDDSDGFIKLDFGQPSSSSATKQ